MVDPVKIYLSFCSTIMRNTVASSHTVCVYTECLKNPPLVMVDMPAPRIHHSSLANLVILGQRYERNDGDPPENLTHRAP